MAGYRVDKDRKTVGFRDPSLASRETTLDAFENRYQQWYWVDDEVATGRPGELKKMPLPECPTRFGPPAVSAPACSPPPRCRLPLTFDGGITGARGAPR